MAPTDLGVPTIAAGVQESTRRESAGLSKLLIYFAPDFTEVSTITRAHGFLDHGFEVAVFAFRRRRYNPDFTASWKEVDLGRTRDGAYLQRAAALLCAVPALWANRRLLRRARMLYARNLDQLALASLARFAFGLRAGLTYEVLDIPSLYIGSGPIVRLVRWLERLMLKNLDVLVVSSPAFLRDYYEPIQRYRGRTALLENKLHPSAAAAIARPPATSPERSRFAAYKWVVGYFGLIRGQRTFDLMIKLAERFPDDVLFYFRGVVTTVEQESFNAAIAGHKNMIYEGPYVNPHDLAQLYRSVDFTWAIDLESRYHNSRWLMPCRFYESGLVGTPCIAAEGFEVGSKIASLGIGWTVATPYEQSLAKLFATLGRAEYESVKQVLRAIPRSAFVAGDDVRALCGMIGGQTIGR